MDFYKKLLIKLIESSSSGSESKILDTLKSGNDLTQKERKELEELIENLC
jgi:hypothetical protein